MKATATVGRPLQNTSFDIASLHNLYASGVEVATVIDEIFSRLDEANDPAIFISLCDRATLQLAASSIGRFDPESKPLWGIPFAIKDNIDAQDMPTTAACPAFAYVPDSDAFSVSRLLQAGAILIGKTNLDQFATGLVGVRSPFGAPRNAINASLVPGGSSSGSAVAVSRGIVSFALGTDTAGSGRVPAALNNIVGLKPTLGAISSRGLVPACRTLDTISIFSLTVPDAVAAFRAVAAPDTEDAFSRSIKPGSLHALPQVFDVLVPGEASREFFGDVHQAASFEETLKVIADMGGRIRSIDFTPFFDVARLLYEGPWVAERYTVLKDLLVADEDAIHPVVAGIVKGAERFSAADAFEARYRLETLRKRVAPLVRDAFALCVPTIPRFLTLDEVYADPVGSNSQLGIYTNFVNLLDMCGIAVPVAPRDDGLPGSVTLLGEAGSDMRLAVLAGTLHARLGRSLGATGHAVHAFQIGSAQADPDEIELAAVGAHMSGLPLNGELRACGARFVRATCTAPEYRLFALEGGPPFRPGMVQSDDGSRIALETWAIPRNRFGDFIAGIPAPLCIGTVKLEDGSFVKGFLCEQAGLRGARDITEFGGWRRFINER